MSLAVQQGALWSWPRLNLWDNVKDFRVQAPPSEKLTLPVCSDASEELNQCLWIFKHSFNKYLKRWRDNSMPGIAHYPNGA